MANKVDGARYRNVTYNNNTIIYFHFLETIYVLFPFLGNFFRIFVV